METINEIEKGAETPENGQATFDPIELLNSDSTKDVRPDTTDGLLADLELVDNKNTEVTPGEMSKVELNLDGNDREYEIYVPEGHEGPMPVMYVFHGLQNKDPAGLMAKETEMNRYADEHGFAVVYPLAHAGEDGLYSWNSPGAGLTETDASYDDVDYMKAILESVNGLGLDIDDKDQILVGFSEGGQFVHHLAGEMPGIFTDRAAIHGTLLGTETKPTESMPTLLVHSAYDHMLPADGGMGMASRVAHLAIGGLDKINQSQPRLQAQWAIEANQCEGDWQISDDVNNITIDNPTAVYSEEQCNGNQVTFYILPNAQHAWHGVGEGGMIMGQKDPNFNASEAVIDNLLGY